MSGRALLREPSIPRVDSRDLSELLDTAQRLGWPRVAAFGAVVPEGAPAWLAWAARALSGPRQATDEAWELLAEATARRREWGAPGEWPGRPEPLAL